MQNFNAQNGCSIFSQQQILIGEAIIIFSNNQGANALAVAINRHDGGHFALEDAFGVSYEGAVLILMRNVRQSILYAHDERQIILRQMHICKHLFTHSVAFKLMNQCITLDVTVTVSNIGVGLDNVAQQLCNSVVLYIITLLQQFVNFSCFF